MKAFYETFDHYWDDLVKETIAVKPEDEDGIMEYLEGVKPLAKKTWEVAFNSGVIEYKHAVIQPKIAEPVKKFNKRY